MLTVTGIGSAAVLALPPVREQLVEGHTVFTVIESIRGNTSASEEFAAAVAVLVREYKVAVDATRFPGVLWFNDQYLMAPTSLVNQEADYRYPCGAVLMVESGSSDPRGEFLPGAPTPPTYIESYHITDPNNRAWDIDKWRRSDGSLVWTVAIMNNQAEYSAEDDGAKSCGMVTDAACASGVYAPVTGGCITYLAAVPNGPRFAKDPGDHGMGYPCGADGTNPNCANLRYNAVLYVLLEDLQGRDTPKDHTPGSADSTGDVAGCHQYGQYANGEFWPCPNNDDDREGNSHPYNPDRPWPVQAYDGRGNHGGSADCDGDGLPDGSGELTYLSGDYNCHATVDVDIYWGSAYAPLLRNFRVMDSEGGTAPYHCHEDNLCSPEDAFP